MNAMLMIQLTPNDQTKYNQWLHHDLRKCYMKVTILFSYYVFLFTGKRAHFQVEKEGWREVGY